MGEGDIDRAFWERQTRAGNVLNLGIVLLDLAYAALTWSTGPNRPALLAVNLAALAGIVGAMVTVPAWRIARSEQRTAVFVGWSIAGSLLVTYGTWLDGGLGSPMAWLLPISVMFTAMMHRPPLVLASAACALGGYLLLALDDGRFGENVWQALTPAGYLVAVGYAGAVNARSRWGHYDDQVALRDELALLADHDGLTGLLNHRAFRGWLDREVALAREHGTVLTLLAIDLDHFKAVNDVHGHAAGDEVLRATAGAIVGATRDVDVIGRIGGEEFCVALPGTDHGAGALIAERVRRAIAGASHGQPWTVTASVGLGCFPHDSDTAGGLLDAADRALYVAKRAGRNQVRVATPAA
jgi:diguanylate cyclase (GGDEF)-like protein